jgi:hypothetical protein
MHLPIPWWTQLLALSLATLVGCADDPGPHPWLTLPEGSRHRIVESMGPGEGQIVVAMDPEVKPEEALELGRSIQAQAPAEVTVNARLYNDEGTARNWRRVAADWTREHLWVTVVIVPESGRNEVRWVGPELPGAPAPPEHSPSDAPPTSIQGREQS